jgi:hypothetical protein
LSWDSTVKWGSFREWAGEQLTVGAGEEGRKRGEKKGKKKDPKIKKKTKKYSQTQQNSN